jgi:elongation factor G
VCVSQANSVGARSRRSSSLPSSKACAKLLRAARAYAVTDVAVTLTGGSSHPVDSTEIAYRAAASTAFRDGLRQGQPVLLEPIFRIEVLTPAEFTGAVHSQLAARHTDIERMEARPGGIEAIAGQAPLSELFGYVTALRSGTQGRAALTMEFDHYAPMEPARAKAALSGSF